MSRRPAIKIALPVLIGLSAVGVPTSGSFPCELLAVNLFLLIFPLFLRSRLPDRLLDFLLILLLYLSGLVAIHGAQIHPRVLEKGDGSDHVVIFEVEEAGQTAHPGRFQVYGRLKYLSRSDSLRSCPSGIVSYLDAAGSPPLPGSQIIALGRLSRPEHRKNPGGMSEAEWMGRKGVVFVLRTEGGEWSVLEGSDHALGGTSKGAQIRARLGAAIEENYGDGEAAFIRGLLLGERGDIPYAQKVDFSRSGIAHILAISGFNFAILAGMIILLLSVMRLPRLIGVLLTIPVLVAYGFVTGMGASIQRALVMTGVVFLTTSLQKKIDTLNLLSGAALALGFLSPPVIRDPAFQMSFLATWGILALYPGSYRRICLLLPWRFPPVRWFFQMFMVSLSAQLPLVPVLATNFHAVSVVSPVTNLLAIPLTAILLPAAILSIGARAISPILSDPFSEAASFLVQALFWIAERASAYSWSAVPVASFVPLSTLAYYIILFTIGLVLEGGVGRGAFLAVVLLAANLWMFGNGLSGESPLQVTFLDVGQGDGAVVEFPAGGVMVVDGGPKGRSWDAGERVIEPFLHEKGIDRIDILAISHPQLDHAGGFSTLQDRFETRMILDPGKAAPVRFYQGILQRALNQRTPICFPRRGDSFSIGEVSVRFFHPTEERIREGSGANAVNDVSLVMKISYGEIDFLFAGDIEADVENELAEQFGEKLEAEVLKVPHHGSRTSSSPSFLRSVAPLVAVISVGRNNSFDHPSPEVLHRMHEEGILALRTDIHGAIEVVVGEGRFDVYDGSECVLFRHEETDRDETVAPFTRQDGP